MNSYIVQKLNKEMRIFFYIYIYIQRCKRIYWTSTSILRRQKGASKCRCLCSTVLQQRRQALKSKPTMGNQNSGHHGSRGNVNLFFVFPTHFLYETISTINRMYFVYWITFLLARQFEGRIFGIILLFGSWFKYFFHLKETIISQLL